MQAIGHHCHCLTAGEPADKIGMCTDHTDPPGSPVSDVSRRDIANLVASQLDADPDWVNRVLEQFLIDVVAVVAGGGRVTLRGFGVVAPRMRPAQVRRKPDTGERIDVPPRWTVTLRPSRNLLKQMNEQVRP